MEKYKYEFEIDFKIECCINCPFRHERIFKEDVRSHDKISGVVGIERIHSECILTKKPVRVNEYIFGNQSCPLRSK